MDVNQELKFLGKIRKKKKNRGGGGGVRVCGGGGGVRGGCERNVGGKG